MTKEELAALLNGREYGSEMTDQEEVQAKENGLVVVFGYSDDNVEFRGAINEEIGAPGEVYFNKDGFNFTDESGHAPMTYMRDKDGPEANLITATYSPCNFKTEIPHATFDVMEDDDLFGVGIVFSIDDLK